VGKLSAKKLASTKMAKSIHDAGTTMFKTMLKYKASARQRWYVEVDETNTTRTCSSCGVIPASSPKGLKGLSIREWVCCECGAIHDRDINAALNILRIGRDTLASKVS
jgi:transposase